VQRVLWLVALAGFAAAGLAAGYVVASPAAGSTSVKNGVTICHATSSHANPFVEQTPSADGVLSAHIHHPDDIIPPFEVVENGKLVIYPGKNMEKAVCGGYTGVELLANGCRHPTGHLGATTVPAAIIEPGPTITIPAMTEIKTVTEKIVEPARTVHVPATSTVLTVPAGATTTVTLPERTVIVPASTETIHGERIVRPAETVTLAATTTTETAGATATVVTVTGPDKVVEHGVNVSKEEVVTVTIPGHTVHEPAHTVPLHEHGAKRGETVTETVPTTTIEHATSITVLGVTTTETKIERIVVPETTVTVPEETTVVTVPAGATTTVTLPERTVTVPRSGERVKGVLVSRPLEVVTLPATTRTVTGGTGPSVVTVTGPNTVTEGGSVVTKRVLVAVTTPSRVVRVPAHVIRVEEKKFVIVVRLKGCPPGTASFHGGCSPIARGKG
jgi:hypothetical protein